MAVFKDDRNHLSLEDIHRYLDNQMLGEEMHFVERHLLECDLCSEAFEGYQDHRESVSYDTVQRLTSRLKSRTESKNHLRLTVAASIAILLCASMVFMFNYLENGVDEVSLLEKSGKGTIVGSALDEDSLTLDMKEKGQEKHEEVEQFDSEEKGEEKLKRAQSVGQLGHEKSSKQIIAQAKPIETDRGFIEENDSGAFGADEGEVEVETLFVVGEKTLENVALSEVDGLDGPSEFTLSEGIVQAEGKPDKKLAAAGAIDHNRQSATSERTARSKPIVAPVTIRKEETKLPSQNAVPIVGFDSYKLYLKDSLQYPESAREARIEGEVKLSFGVTKKGRIKELTVVKGLSIECDLEAKRLVLEGSKWLLIDKNLIDENNIVNLTIDFSLRE